MVDILSKVSPNLIKEVQKENADISETMHYVKTGKKLTLAEMHKLNQDLFEVISASLTSWFSINKSCTDCMSKKGTKYHQLILPIEFRVQVMELLHNEQGLQAVEYMLELVKSNFILALFIRMSIIR